MLYNTERPLTFDSFRGQKYIVESIRAQAINQKFFGVYLFGGHFGCGKTSMARTITLAANCEHLDEHGNPCLTCSHCKSILSGSMDIVEIDAATNTGVDSIRELRETVSFKPAELKRKFYIIDEVHMLSKGAFNALLKVLEEPPEFVTFILCTTEINAIPATIRSRGACYFFEQLTCSDLAEHVEQVAQRNGITLLADAANMIAKYSQGAARNALSILEQVSSMNMEVSAEMVQMLLGVSDNTELFHFARELLAANTMGAVSVVESLSAAGKDFSLLCDDLIEIVTDTILYSIGGKDSVTNTEQYIKNIEQLVAASNSDRLCELADQLHALKNELRLVPGKGTVLAAVIRLTMDSENSIIALTSRISALEKELAKIKTSGVSMAKLVVEDSVLVEPVDTKNVVDEAECAVLDNDSHEDEKMLGEVSDECNGPDEIYPAVASNDVVCDVDESEEGAGFNPVSSMNEVPFTEDAVVSVDKEESKAEEASKVDAFDDFDFDFFDVFDSDIAEADTMPTLTSANEELSTSEISDEVLKEAERLIERIAIEHSVFATALKGCTISQKTDGLYIETELPDVRTLVGFYRNHYANNGFEAAKNIIV